MSALHRLPPGAGIRRSHLVLPQSMCSALQCPLCPPPEVRLHWLPLALACRLCCGHRPLRELHITVAWFPRAGADCSQLSAVRDKVQHRPCAPTSGQVRAQVAMPNWWALVLVGPLGFSLVNLMGNTALLAHLPGSKHHRTSQCKHLAPSYTTQHTDL